MEQYHVTGMTCAACSAHVEKAVKAVDGVTSVTVSLLTNAMSVEGSASPQAVIAAVEKAGYGASLPEPHRRNLLPPPIWRITRPQSSKSGLLPPCACWFL